MVCSYYHQKLKDFKYKSFERIATIWVKKKKLPWLLFRVPLIIHVGESFESFSAIIEHFVNTRHTVIFNHWNGVFNPTIYSLGVALNSIWLPVCKTSFLIWLIFTFASCTQRRPRGRTLCMCGTFGALCVCLCIGQSDELRNSTPAKNWRRTKNKT